MAEFKLTDRGRRKLDRVFERVVLAARKTVRDEIRQMRSAAAAYAPNPNLETVLLSRGQALDGPNALDIVGTPDFGRFIRRDKLPVQIAIVRNPIKEKVYKDGRFIATTGDAKVINRQTGFYWRTRRKGVVGPTQPFYGLYMEALEYGGIVWVVVPRKDGGILEPEPGVTARQVAKTIQPYQPYRRAMRAGQRRLVKNVRDAVRQAARGVR